MPIDAIIRVSFESVTQANQAVNSALVGHAQNATGNGPFGRVKTATYECRDAPDADVHQAIAALVTAITQYSASLDYLSISMTRHDGAAQAP